MNDIQLLRDKDTEPTEEIIAEGLGAAYGVYPGFIETLKEHDIHVDWRYYNDGKSWLGKALYKWTTSRGTQKETTAFWLSIWEGFFKVSFFIPEKVREETLNLPLSKKVKKMIADSSQMGKLKLFPLIFDLRSDELFEDIYLLADFRSRLK